MTAVSRKGFVKVDCYAIFDLRREYNLDSGQWPMLLALVLLADHRDSRWSGSIAELAAHYTKMGTKRVARVIDELADLGLIEVVDPFGPNSQGTIKVVVYDELVVPETRGKASSSARRAETTEVVPSTTESVSNDASVQLRNRVEVASHSGANRVGAASGDALDQGFRGERRSEAVRERGREPTSGEHGPSHVAPDEEWDPDAPMPWLDPEDLLGWTSTEAGR